MGGRPGLPETVPEGQFMETQLSSVFTTVAVEYAGGRRSTFLLNPVDYHGALILTTCFETLGESYIGLIDMITAATSACNNLDAGLMHVSHTDTDAFVSVQQNVERWHRSVDDPTRWQKYQEQQIANSISIA